MLSELTLSHHGAPASLNYHVGFVVILGRTVLCIFEPCKNESHFRDVVIWAPAVLGENGLPRPVAVSFAEPTLCAPLSKGPFRRPGQRPVALCPWEYGVFLTAARECLLEYRQVCSSATVLPVFSDSVFCGGQSFIISYGPFILLPVMAGSFSVY